MDILSLIQQKTGFRRQSARTWEGPCPKCGGSKRLIVWIHQNIFKCRECDFKGSLIQWLKQVEGLGCKQAHAEAGIDCDNTACPVYEKCHGSTTGRKKTDPMATAAVPKEKPAPPVADLTPTEPAAIWQQKASALVGWAHEQLLADRDQLTYLEKRGLDYGAVVEYRLGWIPKDLYRTRDSWGLPEELKQDGITPKKLWIPSGILIPLFTGSQIHRIRIRRPVVKDSETRYYWIPGSGNDTFTINRGRAAAVVVESDLDALLIDHLAGSIVNTVSLGTCSARPKADTAAMLSACTVILVSLDADQAGAGQMKWWSAHYPHAERWPVPVGKDPGEAWQQGIDLRAWLMAGLPVSLHPAEKQERATSNMEKTPAPPAPPVASAPPPTAEPTVFPLVTADGQPFYVTNDPQEYLRLCAEGHIAFTNTEIDIIRRAGFSKEQNARIFELKKTLGPVFGAAAIETIIPEIKQSEETA